MRFTMVGGGDGHHGDSDSASVVGWYDFTNSDLRRLA